ncbi:MAG: recombinase family protein [Planctomycetia bacterium]|nr:recombinase family protein [Planctomycetia bacterium]
METRKCALYGRVSTVRQALIQDGGLDTQFDLMDRYVTFENSKAQGQWLVQDHYREEAYSGKNLERPEFRRMMRDIETGRVNTVIVQKIDRITRSLRDFFDLWETFEQHGVQFISLHEKFDTTTAVGRAMLKLILVFAELEREQTAERTRATMEHRARQGLWNGGRVPGYSIDPKRKGVLVVNTEEARVVLDHIFSKCMELGSAGKVVQHLKKHGIRKVTYQSRRGKQRGGGFYSKMEVCRVLANPVYIGKVRFDDQLHDGQHEPIVPEALFNDVQRVLDKNRERRGNYRDQRTHVFLLQGLIRCGRCGSFMTPKTSIGRGGKKHFDYQCTKHAHSAGTTCDAKYVPAEPAEEYVLAELRKWVLSEEEIQRVVREANEQKDGTLGKLHEEQHALRQRLKENQGKIDAFVQAVEGGGNFRSFSDRLGELEADQQSMQEELATVEMEIEKVRRHTLSVEVLAETYRDFPAMLDELLAAGDGYTVKALIARYVEVIDWHQDEEDASTGTVEIMLFEQAQPPERNGTKRHPDDQVVNAGASGCNEWLPD